MKKVLYLFFILAVLATIGCRKLIDKLFPHPPGEQPATTCRIQSISNTDVVYTFKYNTSGNVDSIIPNTNMDSSPSYLFTFQYDSVNRLRGMRRVSNLPEKFDIIHKYGYTGNLITSDTIYDISTSTYRLWLGILTYDSLNRVNRETREIIYSDNEEEVGGPFIDIFYHYDDDGNLLAREGYPGIEYDEHQNLLRTDVVLQFIARDYSVNNPTGAVNFNAADLPTRFNPPYNFVFYPHEGIRATQIEITDITYKCE